MQISLDSYRVFYYVAQYKSFTKAAEMLYSNQPNVTRVIKNLEQSLGCALFHRTSRSVRLTPEGEELFAHIAPAMQQIHNGEETILMHSAMQMGSVSIGVSEIALHQFLLPVLKQFRREYPNILLNCRISLIGSTFPIFKKFPYVLPNMLAVFRIRFPCRNYAGTQS